MRKSKWDNLICEIEERNPVPMDCKECKFSTTVMKIQQNLYLTFFRIYAIINMLSGEDKAIVLSHSANQFTY